MKKWNGIVIHCSDSSWGTQQDIRHWHLARGFRTTGYHFVIDNGTYANDFRIPSLDGMIETGRNINQIGAHARGYNKTHIGICLIGRGAFTKKQLAALFSLTQDLMRIYDIPVDNIIGHRECRGTHKRCPCFDAAYLRESLYRDDLRAFVSLLTELSGVNAA